MALGGVALALADRGEIVDLLHQQRPQMRRVGHTTVVRDAQRQRVGARAAALPRPATAAGSNCTGAQVGVIHRPFWLTSCG